jgi:hypothetical protein
MQPTVFARSVRQSYDNASVDVNCPKRMCKGTALSQTKQGVASDQFSLELRYNHIFSTAIRRGIEWPGLCSPLSGS